MRAAYFENTGAPDVIKVGDVPAPEPKDREVLLNYLETAYPPRAPARGGWQNPFSKQYLANGSISKACEALPGPVTICASRSTAMRLPGRACSSLSMPATTASGRTMGKSPF